MPPLMVPSAGGPVAGSLARHYRSWKKSGTTRYILDTVKHGFRLPLASFPPHIVCHSRPLSPDHHAFVRSEITRLLSENAIEICSVTPHIVCPVTVVSKKSGKFRTCVNYKPLNHFIQAPKFRYDGLPVVSEMAREGDWMVTLDLKDGFHHVGIAREHQTLLGFEFEGTYYRFVVLPFGLAVSPWAFTRLVRAMVTQLRAKGMRITAYMDDLLLFLDKDMTEAQRLDVVDLLLGSLASFGWHVNMDKSSLVPAQVAEYLGMIIDCQSEPVIRIPKAKITTIRHEVGRCLSLDSRGRLSARQLARAVGLCQSVTRAVLPGRLLLRSCYQCLSQKASWESLIHLTPQAREDLVWWLRSLKQWNGRATTPKIFTHTIITDASRTGWGAVCGDKIARGGFTPKYQESSSNTRELLAVFLAVKSFLQDIRGSRLRILTDNVTTVAYVNHFGGRWPELTEIATALHKECLRAGVEIHAEHLPGVQNQQADALSRSFDRNDWMLNAGLFRRLDALWGPHTVDRFASFLNAHCPRYNSYLPDPSCEAVDAFSQNWKGENNWVNPPFRLLPKVLRHLQACQAVATVISPIWPSQPWFNDLLAMCTDLPEVLPNRKDSFLPGSTGNVEPRKNPKWRFAAFRLSGAPGLRLGQATVRRYLQLMEVLSI
eukprot:TRINITY_DN2492_c0_g1::TRINITY_DN2492_c0_g1_i1::g.8884::m.8884 TRINITY_DN2492_c0_g1::TRINITY_DN2492_c0_g1_i1::g.8884  ORF type:complete len:657 (+),score=31.37,sp/Q99315/YG31B_YEAST/24.66/8e-19,RVT_1/PF00078.22/4.8e-17,Dam/PF05869.6/3.1e-05,RNase_H/PF00075.19/0.001 TRINITY_DN2492_c0_g1_i1:1350-3320(+)